MTERETDIEAQQPSNTTEPIGSTETVLEHGMTAGPLNSNPPDHLASPPQSPSEKMPDAPESSISPKGAGPPEVTNTLKQLDITEPVNPYENAVLPGDGLKPAHEDTAEISNDTKPLEDADIFEHQDSSEAVKPFENNDIPDDAHKPEQENTTDDIKPSRDTEKQEDPRKPELRDSTETVNPSEKAEVPEVVHKPKPEPQNTAESVPSSEDTKLLGDVPIADQAPVGQTLEVDVMNMSPNLTR
jgi:hypothetical protein